jgi:hypothetical protein
MGRITNYTEVTSADPDDILLLDGEDGNRVIKNSNLLKPIMDMLDDLETRVEELEDSENG